MVEVPVGLDSAAVLLVAGCGGRFPVWQGPMAASVGGRSGVKDVVVASAPVQLEFQQSILFMSPRSSDSAQFGVPDLPVVAGRAW